jgi:hypothetical protein
MHMKLRPQDSALIVNKITIGCLFEDYEITLEPSLQIYPEVLLLSS